MSSCSHKRPCDEKKCSPCKEAVMLNIGRYFVESAKNFDAVSFDNIIPPEQQIPRNQIFNQYLVKINDFFRTTMKNLCGSKSPCCVAMATSIADTSIGFTLLGFNSTLSLGNPLVSVPPVPSLQIILDINYNAYVQTIGIILECGSSHIC